MNEQFHILKNNFSFFWITNFILSGVTRIVIRLSLFDGSTTKFLEQHGNFWLSLNKYYRIPFSALLYRASQQFLSCFLKSFYWIFWTFGSEHFYSFHFSYLSFIIHTPIYMHRQLSHRCTIFALAHYDIIDCISSNIYLHIFEKLNRQHTHWLFIFFTKIIVPWFITINNYVAQTDIVSILFFRVEKRFNITKDTLYIELVYVESLCMPFFLVCTSFANSQIWFDTWKILKTLCWLWLNDSSHNSSRFCTQLAKAITDYLIDLKYICSGCDIHYTT